MRCPVRCRYPVLLVLHLLLLLIAVLVARVAAFTIIVCCALVVVASVGVQMWRLDALAPWSARTLVAWMLLEIASLATAAALSLADGIAWHSDLATGAAILLDAAFAVILALLAGHGTCVVVAAPMLVAGAPMPASGDDERSPLVSPPPPPPSAPLTTPLPPFPPLAPAPLPTSPHV